MKITKMNIKKVKIVMMKINSNYKNYTNPIIILII